MPFFTPPHFLGCSSNLLVPEVVFLLLSEGLTGQDLVSPAMGMLPMAVLSWDLQPPCPEPARKRRGRNLSSLQPCPLQQGAHKQQTKHRLWGELALPRAQPARAEAPPMDSERKHSHEVTSVLSHKEILLCPSQTSGYFSIHLDKWMFLYPFPQVGISLSI